MILLFKSLNILVNTFGFFSLQYFPYNITLYKIDSYEESVYSKKFSDTDVSTEY